MPIRTAKASRFPKSSRATKITPARKKMAALIADFYKAALPVLAKEKPANGFLMRGIAHQPHIPLFEERYQLKPACLAVYPMYKGLAQLVGMKKIEGPQTIAEQFERYLEEYDNYDFFFIHYKYTDKYGEDGNFAAKKKAIEDFDAALPILLQEKAGRAGHHRRPLDAVCAQRPFVASAAGAAAFGDAAARTSWNASPKPARTSARSACSRRNF